MNNGMKVKVTLFIVLFLLVVALIVYILSGTARQEREYYNPNPVTYTAQPVQTPSPTPVPTPVSTPVPTPMPTYVPQYTPQPAATAAPAPVYTPVQPVIPVFIDPSGSQVVDPFSPSVTIPPQQQAAAVVPGSGVFQSDSGARLNIHALWSAAAADADHITVTVVVYADHYSIFYKSYQSLFVTFGDSRQALYANEIYSESNDPQQTELGRASFTVPLSPGESRSWPLQVEWQFNGTYGKNEDGTPKEIRSIICGGNILLTR